MQTNEDLLDDFAIRCFRDTGDEDYIAARMAFRAALVTPSLWESLQAVEKYLRISGSYEASLIVTPFVGWLR